MIINKLGMKVERIISWFKIENESLSGEINIDHIDLDTLKKIFKTKEEDPLMYYPYDINEIIAKELTQYINLTFEFDKYTYQLDCFQK